jgi:hypothetical protein
MNGKKEPRMREETATSTLRLYLLRAMYLLNFALLGSSVWPEFVKQAGSWEPMKGVAFSFWAALSTLSALGLRYPLKMLLVLLFQLVYKTIWLLAVWLPTWPTARPTELFKAMAYGAVLDLIVIPWPYVLENYVKKRGDRWKPVRAAAAETNPAEVGGAIGAEGGR